MKNRIIILCLLSFLISANSFAQVVLTANEQNDFANEAKKKVEQLGIYISRIADKQTDLETKDLATDQALQLFYSPNKNIIQISNTYTGTTVDRKITEYLQRLRNLPYSSVEIDWFDAFYVSSLRKGRDGKYYATISVGQKFKATGRDGKLIYGDIINKNVVVIVEPIESATGDVEWMVYLGDIKVTDFGNKS